MLTHPVSYRLISQPTDNITVGTETNILSVHNDLVCVVDDD